MQTHASGRLFRTILLALVLVIRITAVAREPFCRFLLRALLLDHDLILGFDFRIFLAICGFFELSKCLWRPARISFLLHHATSALAPRQDRPQHKPCDAHGYHLPEPEDGRADPER